MNIKVFSHGHTDIQRYLAERGVEDATTTKPKVAPGEYIVEMERWRHVWKDAVERSRPWAVRRGPQRVARDTTFAFSFHATLDAAIAAAQRYNAEDAA